MNNEHSSQQQQRDRSFSNALVALRRAAKRAREQAVRAKNTIVVYRDGKIRGRAAPRQNTGVSNSLQEENPALPKDP